MVNKLVWFTFSVVTLLIYSCSSTEVNKSETNSSKVEEKSIDDSTTIQNDSVRTMIVPDTIYYPYMDQGKYGYRDTAWKPVTDPIYKIAGEFSEGFASALFSDGFWYLINKKFKPVFKFPNFIPIERPNDMSGMTDVMISSEGYLPVQYRSGEFGFMRMKNRSVFGKYDEVLNFSNGLAAVRKGEKWGFIDYTGKFVYPAKFDHVFSFSDNRAYVCEGEHCYFIDKKGNRYFDHKYLRQGYRFKEGLTFVTYSDNYDQYFLIDTMGKIINKGPYDAIYNLGFENGECEVRKNGKCIIIDKNGKKLRDKKDGCQEGC